MVYYTCKTAKRRSDLETALETSILELRKLFKGLNQLKFNNELEEPIITIQTPKKAQSMGHCSTTKVWKNKQSEATFYEINISSLFLNRPIVEIATTMLHEMVHLYNAVNNVKDTSNGFYYHNKKFKQEAESRGLSIEHAEKIGWSVSTATEETIEQVESLDIDEDSFSYFKVSSTTKEGEDGKDKKPRKKANKYKCPKCGEEVKSKNPVHIICKDDDCEFIPLEEDDA